MQFRYSAFAFILLANIILLGHSALPHHHYETHVQFAHSNSLTVGHNEHEDENDSPFHQHDHNTEDKQSNCLLSSIVALPAQQLRNTVNEYDANLETQKIVFSDFINVENHFTVLVNEKIVEILIPPNDLSFLGFSLDSNRLRGPPAI